MTNKHLTDQRLTDLKLIDSLKQGVDEAGFEYCTPIQEKSLPVALAGKDVAGQAQTGTGKTAAFLLACCQQLITNPAPEERQHTNVRGLILAPTRELAIQIYNDAGVLARYTDLKLGLVYGGTGYDEQKQMLCKGADILIGTPGRLIDFYKQNLFDLKLVQVVVLDEADRMFDLGFIKDIRFLLRRMPKPEDRLNMLFSATLSFRVMELAYEHMNNPQEIRIGADTPVADKIEEYAYYPADEEKSTLLVNLLRRENPERVLVFVNTRRVADEVSRTLSANGIRNAAISGDVPQRKRESLLGGFKVGKYKVLVATDVAARGLHIPEVSQVYNFDLPQDADDYVHRIGRTARAGRSGEAISFICEKYAYSIMEIESYIGHAIARRDIEAALLAPIEKAAKQSSSHSWANARSSKKPTPRKPHKRQPVKSRLVEQEVAEKKMDKSRITTAVEKQLDLPQLAEAEHFHPAEDCQVKKTMVPTPAIATPNVKSANESIIDDDKQADVIQIAEQIAAPARMLKIRFSRKFGEVPLVG